MRFRKRPVVVEAVQWQPGVEVEGLRIFEHGGCGDATCHRLKCAVIATLEGPMHVSPGDWIITGVRGEKYPCKPDIFTATYEAAE